MAKDFAKGKCFVKTKGQYEEITYEELLRRCDADETYPQRKLIPLHGMLMEVSLEEYKEFYRERRRQKYLREQSTENRDVSIDALIADDLSGEEILPDPAQDVADQVETRLMTDKLLRCLPLLTAEEQELIRTLFYDGRTEREWSAKTGIPPMTIHDRKVRILKKLKKFLET